MSRKVVLVARDAAPSGCFKRLEPVLKERGLEVVLMIGEGKPFKESAAEVAAAVEGADLVLLGMSSSLELAHPEIVAGKTARDAGVPYGFYGDVPRCWARAREGAWFEDLAPDAAFYLGVTQADADAAREVFPDAWCVGTGNPLREEMAFPRLTREAVRAELGIAPEEKLILAPGGKFAAGNMASWVVVMEALSLIQNEYAFQLVLATHPGDRTETKLYDELVSFSPVPARIVAKDVLTTSEMVPGADLIVEFGSSIGIEGAYQGVPVVSLAFEILLRRHEKASGTRTLEAVNDGLSALVEADASRLAETIRRLLRPSGFAFGFAPMRLRQQELCPKPTERGAALRNIVDAIVAQIA